MPEPIKQVKVGDSVIFHNPSGEPHAAIITAVWSTFLVNLLYVSGDTTRTDVYGRQIERATSCSHVGKTTVHGNYWRFSEEEANQYVPPVET